MNNDAVQFAMYTDNGDHLIAAEYFKTEVVSELLNRDSMVATLRSLADEIEANEVTSVLASVVLQDGSGVNIHTLGYNVDRHGYQRDTIELIRDEDERRIMGIFSDHIGLPFEETEEHVTFVSDEVDNPVSYLHLDIMGAE